MSLPNSVNDLILGKVNTKPPRSNLSPSYSAKEIELKLDKSQLDAIRKLKLLVAATPYLEVFNPNLQARLRIDSSSEGLSAFLEQNHRTLI